MLALASVSVRLCAMNSNAHSNTDGIVLPWLNGDYCCILQLETRDERSDIFKIARLQSGQTVLDQCSLLCPSAQRVST